jgi:hypothetical protein
VPLDDWNFFVGMRKEIKKPMTEAAKSMAVKKLKELKDAGDDPGEVLRQSVINSWQGLFAVKGKKQNLRVVGGNNPNFVGGHLVK